MYEDEDEQGCRCEEVNVDVNMSRDIGENVDVLR